MQLQLMPVLSDARRQRAHRIITEVMPLHRLDKKRGVHATPPETAQQKIQPLRMASGLAQHHRHADRAQRRIGKRPGDAELRIDGKADAHDSPPTAIRPV
ncbi:MULTISPECIES: hypothetical protein [unclassified Duganella]|uniref:hypothetical protein n=1 Tax=unclassified Duganella TaxID=2636909 RepID=UPI0010288B0C|nr:MULTISPECIES: hypothetical protein [unclassified Duganella]